MSEHIIKFSDDAYTVTVTHNKVGDLNQVVFHKKLEDSVIDSKFQLFLDDAQFRNMANFLWFLTGRGDK
jgi:hypothetical protein